MQYQDAVYMARAIELAKKGCWTTDPNPSVACVLVKNDQIIAEGWHIKAGSDHAEVIALKQASNANQSIAYVTLEPCSHTGKTGPCCDVLIAAGVKRVVVAMQDPNPLVAGHGIKKMRAAGLQVDCGVLQQDAEDLNPGFIKRMKYGLPFVRSKLAMSLDGRTAMASGESQWISSPESRADGQRLRAESSAILTGINTVLADDPALNVRLNAEVKQPIRVILDSQLHMPLSAKMLGLMGESWVLTASEQQQKITSLKNAGFKVFQLSNKFGRLDLKAVMLFLGQQQINTVLVEAGATLNAALLTENRVDEWLIYMSPCILGDKGRGLFQLPDMVTMADKKQLNFLDFRRVGADMKLVFSVKNPF